nr:hypothetical protein [uncultured Acetatifactor sp.]
MGYKVYENVINMELMWQMRQMIAEAAGMQLIEPRCRKPLFKRRAVQESMENKFRFHYPGEILERYHERCGDTVQNLRALAIAMADEKEFLKDNMFIGIQKAAFIGRIRRKAEKDIYLQGALYILSEGKEEKKRLEAGLKQYEARDSQEYFYIRSVLGSQAPEHSEDMQGISYFLCEGRTMEAYGNERVFSWAVEFAESMCEGGCKRNAGVVRSLSRMQFHQVKKGSVYWEELRKAGYSGQEILYLNMKLPFLVETGEALTSDSIIAERITAQACEEILNAEHVESPILYQEVVSSLCLYHKFAVKLEGYRCLSDLLRHRVEIRDVDLYLDFYRRKGGNGIYAEWLWVDLSDDRWDRLAFSMSAEEYTELFETCFLSFEEKDSRVWLKKYEKLCGESYLGQFWKRKGHNISMVFRLLVREGLIDIAAYITEYAEDIKRLAPKEAEDKWGCMLRHIAGMVKEMDCRAVFCFWDTYDQLFGMEALREFTRKESLVSSAIGYELYRNYSTYYNTGSEFWMNLDFLSAEEQRKMFSWADDEIFLHSPKNYNAFLLQFLEKKGLDLLPKEQCKELSDVLLKILEPGSRTEERLYHMFYEKEEIDRFAERERIRRAEEEERKQEQQKIEWRKTLRNGMDTDSGKSSLEILAQNYHAYISAKNYHELAFSCISEEINKGNCKIECGRLSELLEAMGRITKRGAAGWDDVRSLINRLEVEDDRPEKDGEED